MHLWRVTTAITYFVYGNDGCPCVQAGNCKWSWKLISIESPKRNKSSPLHTHTHNHTDTHYIYIYINLLKLISPAHHQSELHWPMDPEGEFYIDREGRFPLSEPADAASSSSPNTISLFLSLSFVSSFFIFSPHTWRRMAIEHRKRRRIFSPSL